MKKIVLLIAILFTSPSYAKYIYEYLEGIEPLLIEGKYEDAGKEFQKVDPKIKKFIINKQTNESVERVYLKTVEWLNNNNKIKEILHDVNTHPKTFTASNQTNYQISPVKCFSEKCSYNYNRMKGNLPSVLPFSSKFIDFVNKENQTTNQKFFNTYSSIVKATNVAEAKKRKDKRDQKAADAKHKKELMAAEYQKKKELERQKRKKLELARIKKENEQKAILNAENERINKVSLSLGYLGYSKDNIITMINKTQKNGGLEKYLNKVVGCNKFRPNSCKNWYPKITAIQILDKQILYSFSELSSSGSEYLAFTIIVDKEANKIYQDGQSLRNTFYVFDGMFSYTTVTGATKTIPHFRTVKIN